MQLTAPIWGCKHTTRNKHTVDCRLISGWFMAARVYRLCIFSMNGIYNKSDLLKCGQRNYLNEKIYAFN